MVTDWNAEVRFKLYVHNSSVLLGAFGLFRRFGSELLTNLSRHANLLGKLRVMCNGLHEPLLLFGFSWHSVLLYIVKVSEIIVRNFFGGGQLFRVGVLRWVSPLCWLRAVYKLSLLRWFRLLGSVKVFKNLLSVFANLSVRDDQGTKPAKGVTPRWGQATQPAEQAKPPGPAGN